MEPTEPATTEPATKNVATFTKTSQPITIEPETIGPVIKYVATFTKADLQAGPVHVTNPVGHEAVIAELRGPEGVVSAGIAITASQVTANIDEIALRGLAAGSYAMIIMG